MATIDDAALPDATTVGQQGHRRLMPVIGPIAVGLALLSALATFLVLGGFTPFTPSHYLVVWLLFVNTIAVVLLVGIIAREIWPVIQASRRGRAGARLHFRIIRLFSIISAVPAILVAVVASITIDRGLDQMLSGRNLISDTLVIADIYVREQLLQLRGDTLAMAITLTQAKPLFDQDSDRFRQLFTAQASLRGVSGAMLIHGDRTPIVKSDFNPQPEPMIAPNDRLDQITDTEPRVVPIPSTNLLVSIIKMRGYDDTFLYVVRPIDPRVIALGIKANEMLDVYDKLRDRRLGVQLAFALMYTVILLSVMLSAVWIGLNFTNLLVAPIRRLIGAANLVSTGNLYVQVPVRQSEGDLAQLGETFNKMTQELRTQRDDIVRARDLIDSRRRFTEAVLAGASAGVIGIDAENCITIMNRSAERLIGRTEAEVLGQPLAEIVPELAGMLAAARSGVQRLLQSQVTINHNGRERNLSVRVTSEQSGAAEGGYVVTLDDITELVTAQRTSAWADVARRIAHEIKNPLTPIQLSAERLRRKYGGVITEDGGVFQQCTDTIVRQVDDIKRMVDEFSRFARMPKSVMTAEDVADTVRQVVFLQRVANADIDIQLDIAQEPMPAKFDRRLISQALTNIIKNATEAISAVPPGDLGRGRIRIWAGREGNDIVIDVIDNGVGLPNENRSRLLEPYVTTRDKGTGLGLAIVGRILEEHGGRIELGDAADKIPGQRGAWLRLRFAAETASSNEAEGAPQTQTPQLATNA